jgi:hypothetical protein
LSLEATRSGDWFSARTFPTPAKYPLPVACATNARPLNCKHQRWPVHSQKRKNPYDGTVFENGANSSLDWFAVKKLFSSSFARIESVMSNRRLLACNCGRTVPVEPRQAGGETTCACGAKLLIPPLRQLRDLPEELSAGSKTGATWGLSQGIISLLVVAALLLATTAGYYRLSEPPKPQPFDFSNWQTESKAGIAKLTPEQLWQHWIDVYAPQVGANFQVYKSVEDQIATGTIAHHRKLEGYLGIGAAIFAGMAGLLFAMFKNSRPG